MAAERLHAQVPAPSFSCPKPDIAQVSMPSLMLSSLAERGSVFRGELACATEPFRKADPDVCPVPVPPGDARGLGPLDHAKFPLCSLMDGWWVRGAVR